MTRTLIQKNIKKEILRQENQFCKDDQIELIIKSEISIKILN